MGHMGHLMIRLITGCAAPMSPAGLALKRTVLDRPLRHIKPIAIDIHLYPRRGHTVGRWPTIPLIAATRAGGTGEAGVDVMGFCLKLRPYAEEGKPGDMSCFLR